MEIINVGNAPFDPGADNLRDAFKKVNVNFDLLQVLASSGFGGAIDLLSPVPESKGYYVPSENGTYSNYGNISVDLTDGFTAIIYDGENFSKQVVPIDLAGYATKKDASKLSVYRDYIYTESEIGTAVPSGFYGEKINVPDGVVARIGLKSNGYKISKFKVAIQVDRVIYPGSFYVLPIAEIPIGMISYTANSEGFLYTIDYTGNAVDSMFIQDSSYYAEIINIELSTQENLTDLQLNKNDVVSTFGNSQKPVSQELVTDFYDGLNLKLGYLDNLFQVFDVPGYFATSNQENTRDGRIKNVSFKSVGAGEINFLIGRIDNNLLVVRDEFTLVSQNSGMASFDVDFEILAGEFLWVQFDKVFYDTSIPRDGIRFGTIEGSIEAALVFGIAFQYTILPNYLKYLPKEVIELLPDFEITLPSEIDVACGEIFDIYYRNIIFKSEAFEKLNLYITARQKTAENTFNSLGDGYAYKWSWSVPAFGELNTDIEVEFRVVDIYTGIPLLIKDVVFHCKNYSLSTGGNKKVVFLGDSFSDGYGVSYGVYSKLNNLPDYAFDFIGVNAMEDFDGNVVPGAKDDAWGGWGFAYFATNPLGYLRSDRPLNDAVWDSGWGENQPNGWTTGQTYADLTPTQRSHGQTRNQFWNPDLNKFDFSYYMSHYHPGISNIDAVVNACGINDAVWWNSPTLKALLVSDYIPNIYTFIDSVRLFSSSTKILLHTIPPQSPGDNFMNTYSPAQEKFNNAKRAKYNQEIWNKMMMDNFDTPEMKANNVFVMPSSANFDSRFSYISADVQPCKYKPDYSETITTDVHPNEIGSKYLADSIWMAVAGRI